MLVRHAAFAIALALPLTIARSGSAQAVASASADFSARPAWPTPRSDSTVEPVLVELRVGRLASRTVRAFHGGNDLLIPVGALLQLAEIEYRIAPSGRVDAEWPDRGTPLSIDPARDTVRAGERRVALNARERYVADAELYVAATPLGTLLDAHFVIDWRELVVTLDDADQLPISKRLERETARRLLAERRGRGTATPDFELGPSRSTGNGLVLDYSFTAPSASPWRGSGYGVALGADLLGGSLEGAITSVGRMSDGRVRGGLSWTGVWSDATIVKQLQLGDALSSGPSPRALRGVFVGNSPYLRASDFGEVSYLGQFDPGWMVEAYRGGELVAFDSADAAGRFDIRLPVQYGQNSVDLMAYGPHGERYTLNRVYHVPGELLPQHRVEYGASGGVCATRSCRATANADLRYGLFTRWTVRGGLDRFWRDTLPDLVHPYASITGALPSGFAVQLSGAMRASTRAVVRFEPSLALRLTGEYTQYARDVKAPILTAPGQTSRLLATATVRPLGVASSVITEAWAERSETTAGTLTRAYLGAIVQRDGARLSPYTRLEHDAADGRASDTRPFVGVSASVLPVTRLGTIFGRIWWRGAVEASSTARLQRASFAIARALGRVHRGELGASWERGARGALITFTLAANGERVRTSTTVTSRDGAAPSALQSLRGSVLVDRATKDITLVPGPALQRAGVEGRVFLDANANGRWDPDEPRLDRVRVRVGAQGASSDASGTFRVWDITPFEPVLITVDSMTLASPLWVPLFPSMHVVPGPNRFQFVDVPIVPGGVIEGRVLRASESTRQGAGGVRLLLRNRRTGTTRAITTFSDGEFAALAVAPGSYELSVDGRDLAQLGGAAPVVRIDVPPDVDGARLTNVELVITRH